MNPLRALAIGLVLSFLALSCSEPRSAGVKKPASSRGYAIIGVTVIDGHEVLRDRDVIVRGGQVESVSPTRTTTLPPELERIDGAKKTLLPGLIDMHTHYVGIGGAPWGSSGMPHPETYAAMQLYAGVTTALIATSGPDDDALLAKREAREVLAPHLFLAGPGLTAPGGHPIPLLKALVPWPFDWWAIKHQPVAATPEEASAAVDRIAGSSPPPFLKIFFDALPEDAPELPKEVLKAAIEAARQHGMRPVVHIGTPADMVTAAELGAALLMHVADRAELREEQIEQIAKTGVPFVTTVRIWSATLELVQHGPAAFEKEVVAKKVLAAFEKPPPGYVLPGFEKLQPHFPEMAAAARANVKKLAARGVRFFVGTDTGVPAVFPGAGTHSEMAALVELGIDPLSVIEAATSAPAGFLDPRGSFGRVAKGQRADLLMVRGDPSTDIHALEAIEAVFLDGVKLERSAAH